MGNAVGTVRTIVVLALPVTIRLATAAPGATSITASVSAIVERPIENLRVFRGMCPTSNERAALSIASEPLCDTTATG